VTFAALRSAQHKLSFAFVALAAVVLASCGGGGASVSPSNTGPIALLPGSGSLYAGVPYTFNITGGRAPYLVTSSEQTLLPLNITVSGSTFQVTPFNPGVVDVGLQTGEVPRRTVNIQVRDSANQTLSASFNVLQNFFTGYGMNYTTTCTTQGAQACAGLDTVVRFSPVSQGALYGNRLLQVDKIRGDWQWVVEDPNVTPQLVDRLQMRTDQVGVASIRLRVVVGASTQIASYNLTDVQTGTTETVQFIITQGGNPTTISIVPNSFTFTGGLAGTCGAGSGSSLVFGGKPPYTIQSSSNLIFGGPNPLPASTPLTVTVPSGITTCPTGTISVTDSQGATATIQVTSSPGSGTPPPITVSPSTMILTCSAPTATSAVVGGGGALSAVSSHPRVAAVISGNVLTVTRLQPDVPVVAYPATATIAITDGASIVNVTASVPASCP